MLYPLQKGPSEKGFPWYDTKLHLMVGFQFWRVWSTPSLLLVPGPLLPGVVTPVRVLSMAQIDLGDALIV